MTDESSGQRRTIVWGRADQVDLARAVRERVDLTVVAAGHADGGAATAMADGLEARRATDLRHTVREIEHDLLWILDASGLTGEDLAAVLERSALTLSHEPVADRVPPEVGVGLLERVRLIPLMRRGAAMEAFADMREAFGPVRSVNVAARGRREHGSLYARLTDALDALEWLCGPAEQLDAAMSGPLGEPPAILRDFDGHVSVNARFASNCCGCAQVSNMGAGWARGVTVLGDRGCARITDTILEWWNPEGELVDSGVFADEGDFNELVARQIERALDPRRGLEPTDTLRALAACEAARLSLRTLQGESPRKLLEMMRS